MSLNLPSLAPTKVGTFISKAPRFLKNVFDVHIYCLTWGTAITVGAKVPKLRNSSNLPNTT
ncbi:hypothetical protein FOXYSP1_05721 [Fusarium oxysporum f. sp. phaseoli]